MKEELDPNRCKESVTGAGGWRFVRCSRKVWKDGFCKQHHPDSVKARSDASMRRFKERMDRQNRPAKQLKQRTEALQVALTVLKYLRTLRQESEPQQDVDHRLKRAIEAAEEALSC